MAWPVAGSRERTRTDLVMRSTAVDGADAAGREADSRSEKPLASCSRYCCVRSCTRQHALLSQRKATTTLALLGRLSLIFNAP